MQWVFTGLILTTDAISFTATAVAQTPTTGVGILATVTDCGTACVLNPAATLTFDDGGSSLGGITDCSAWTDLGTVGGTGRYFLELAAGSASGLTANVGAG